MSSAGKNKYTFSWQFEDMDLNRMFRENNDLMFIQSPLFITKNLSQATWYVSVHRDQFTKIKDIEKKLDFNRLLVSLHRYPEVDGEEEVAVYFNLNAFSSEKKCLSLEKRDISQVHMFKKGNSSAGCELTQYSELSLQNTIRCIRCNMTGFVSVDKAISDCCTFYMKNYIIKWNPKNLLESKTISVTQGIRYNVFFTVSNGIISISIRRSDCNNFIKCYIDCLQYMLLGETEFNLIKLKAMDSDYLPKHLNVNDALHFPTNEHIKNVSNFQYPVKLLGFIFIFSDTEFQYSTCKEKLEINIAQELDLTDVWRKDQLRLFESGIHADVKLQIGSELFSAHKCILASHSPVFYAMFDQNMVENQTGIVNITDLDTSTMKSLLQYMYANVVGELQYESALKLLIAADKYQVLLLKRICSEYLLNSLTDENVCEVLAVADITSQSELKFSAIMYVKEHVSKVFTSDDWKRLIKTNIILVGEILSMISELFGTPLDKNDGIQEGHNKSNISPELETDDVLRKDQLQLFESGIHSDVKLQIGSELFSAHKCILASRSPVFYAMFDQDMAEHQTGIVNITDMDASTMKSLLQYMYANVVGELQYESALKLLIAADKYQVLLLKRICSDYLLNSLADENVCEVLAAADKVSQSDLKNSALKYLKKHASKILLSVGWTQLVNTNGDLARDTLIIISEYFSEALNKN